MQSTKSPGASLSFPIPSVSLSQSPLMSCVVFPFSICMCVIDGRDLVVVVMSIFMNFYILKINWQHWWPLLILDGLFSQSTSQCAYQHVMDYTI